MRLSEIQVAPSKSADFDFALYTDVGSYMGIKGFDSLASEITNAADDVTIELFDDPHLSHIWLQGILIALGSGTAIGSVARALVSWARTRRTSVELEFSLEGKTVRVRIEQTQASIEEITRLFEAIRREPASEVRPAPELQEAEDTSPEP
jgi:hypothetical protein